MPAAAAGARRGAARRPFAQEARATAGEQQGNACCLGQRGRQVRGGGGQAVGADQCVPMRRSANQCSERFRMKPTSRAGCRSAPPAASEPIGMHSNPRCCSAAWITCSPSGQRCAPQPSCRRGARGRARVDWRGRAPARRRSRRRARCPIRRRARRRRAPAPPAGPAPPPPPRAAPPVRARERRYSVPGAQRLAQPRLCPARGRVRDRCVITEAGGRGREEAEGGGSGRDIEVRTLQQVVEAVHCAERPDLLLVVRSCPTRALKRFNAQRGFRRSRVWTRCAGPRNAK